MLRVGIGKIKPQPDVVRFEGREAAYEEFAESKLTAGEDIVHFKRFVVEGEGTPLDGRKSGRFDIIINLRANTVTFAAKPECPATAKTLYLAFLNEVVKYEHKHEKGRVPHPLILIDEPSDDVARCTVEDGIWFTAVLHEIRDKGGFNMSAFEAKDR